MPRSHADTAQPARSARERALAREMLASRILARADIPATLEVSVGDRHTELEAEVEVETEVQAPRWWPWSRTRAGRLRLEPSLVQAIERCSDGIILLEGEPGSGKTVSLHRVERCLARQIRETPTSTLPLPLCIKLKYLANERTPREQLMACILRSLDSDVAVAQRLFDQGTRCGGWLLLLDGFDEIPGVLGAIEIDTSVRAYALAIHDLYTDINQDPERVCRIVVATRHYHGPRGVWRSVIRLRPLSPTRRMDFIRNFNLSDSQTAAVVDHLATAPVEIQMWADNPLALAMLCAVVEVGDQPPDNLYGLFERYLALRFSRDAGRLRELYHGSIAQLRRSAEDIGFVMSAEPGLGLAPSSKALRAALERHGLPANDLERTLKAIEGLDLVIREEHDGQLFTGFRHRRLQEYFATCVLLREPDRISPDKLLFDAQWREATVVLLQQGDQAVLLPIFERIEQALLECHAALNLPTDLEHFLEGWSFELLKEPNPPCKIDWPERLSHLLSLMQAGFAYRRDLPETIQLLSLSLLSHIYRFGIRVDKKDVLEVVGVLPPVLVESFALAAFDSKSELLQDVAFKQIPRIGEISAASLRLVSRLLIRMARTGKLAEDHLATRARIRRTNSRKLETFLEMASRAVSLDRPIRLLLFLAYLVLLMIFAGLSGAFTWRWLVLGVFLVLPPLGALLIRDLSSKASLLLRLSLDLSTILPIVLLTGLLVRHLGLEAVGLFLIPPIWAYAYAWAFFMLVAVYFQIEVSRREWPFILPRLFLEFLKLPKAFIKLAAIVTLMTLAFWTLPEPAPNLPIYLMVPIVVAMGAFSIAFALAIGRQGYLHARDWLTERARRSEHRGMTAPALFVSLAGLRTGRARIQLLRDVMAKQTISIDRTTYEELGAFVVALENHALAVEKTDVGSFRALFAIRLRFTEEYRASCRSEHQRWCLQHFAHDHSVNAMHDVIDLLTRLLVRAEQVASARAKP